MTFHYNLCLLEERTLFKNFKNIFGEYTSLGYQKWAKPHSQPVLSSACPCPGSTVTACAAPLRSCAKKAALPLTFVSAVPIQLEPRSSCSRAPAALTFFCYWLQSPPARKVPPRPVRRPLAAPPARGKWPITKVIIIIMPSLTSSTAPGSAKPAQSSAGLRCWVWDTKGSAPQPGLPVQTVNMLVKHLKLFLGLGSATPRECSM